MSKPICVKCEVEFKPHTNGVYVKEMFQRNNEVYKLWMADLWECPICATQIVFGFGQKPLAHHFETEAMEAKLKEIQDAGQVVIRNLDLTGR